MKDTNFDKIISLTYTGGGWLPTNQAAMELSHQCGMGEVVNFKPVQSRDISFHRAYMGLLAYIWGLMPRNFQAKVPKDQFYMWLKHLKGSYDVKYEFADGTKLVEYESISFAKMDQKRFEDYVREQLPWIYEDVIWKVYANRPDIVDTIIENVEEEFKKFLSKL